MSESVNRQFGLIVAYLLPGFIGLAGVAPMFPVVAEWLQPVEQGGMGFGPPIYALLAAITVGMIVSCVRWLVIDTLLAWTGVPDRVGGYEVLAEKLEAHDYLVQMHYHFYQFYSNGLVAIVWSYGMNRLYRTLPLLGPGTDLGMLTLCAVLLLGSRDALTKYRTKLGRLLGPIAGKGSDGVVMTNGADHHAGGAGTSKTRPESKPADKSKPVETKGDKATK